MNKIKSFFSNLKENFITSIKKGELLCAAVIAVVLTFILEMLGRRSFLEGLSFLFESPLLFLYNLLIVLVTLSFAFFMKKRFFGFALVSLFWIVIGVTNFVLQSMRVVPLTSIDFSIVTINLLITYIGVFGVVLLAAGIIAAVAAFFIFYRKLPKQNDFGALRAVFTVVLLSAVMIAFSLFVVPAATQTEKETMNINDSYETYGFAASFARTFVEKGISEPENYSQTLVESLLPPASDHAENTDVPNVIIVQLESFFDAKYLCDAVFSSDPCPVFTHLKETCVSGLLSVPYVGAGTVNTEFEILAGMNIDCFGLGEYPYKSVLQEKSCETVASVLHSYGHTATAIHNYEGTFYGRNTVYSNLGFDRFIPVEFMTNTEKNAKGWVKDKVLLPYIEKTLEKSENRDFVFCVTVQSHGSYPNSGEIKREITVENVDEKYRAEYEYYANEIHEVDTFVGALVSYLESFEEPTVLVLYGDHLPCLTNLGNDSLNHGNVFTTEYVIWSNYGLAGEDRYHLEAYQLASYLFELLGIDRGVMFRSHSEYSENDNYDEITATLQYDILFGENYSGAVCETADMTFGIGETYITSVTMVGNSLYVNGSGFNEYSVVYSGGFARNTEYVSSQILRATGIGLNANSETEVKQVGADGFRYN